MSHSALTSGFPKLQPSDTNSDRLSHFSVPLPIFQEEKDDNSISKHEEAAGKDNLESLPFDGYSLFNQTRSATAPGLHRTGGPSQPEAELQPCSGESRGKAAGGPTGKPHPHTSRLAVVYLENTAVPERRVRSPLHTTARRCDHRGRDPRVGVREARQLRCWDPSRQPRDLRTNSYLRAAPPHLPQTGRSSRKRNARRAPPLPGPRKPARDPDPQRPCGLTGGETP